MADRKKDMQVDMYINKTRDASESVEKNIAAQKQGLGELKAAIQTAVPLGVAPVNLKTVTLPQIPYLAKGAVLPANKPFMAVVGDQKRGVNVEAPLVTIQEAVAQVMQDNTSAMVAGFAASMEVQREILQAVLGIQIGDDVIGNAVSRYQRKMAVVNGGMA